MQGLAGEDEPRLYSGWDVRLRGEGWRVVGSSCIWKDGSGSCADKILQGARRTALALTPVAGGAACGWTKVVQGVAVEGQVPLAGWESCGQSRCVGVSEFGPGLLSWARARARVRGGDICVETASRQQDEGWTAGGAWMAAPIRGGHRGGRRPGWQAWVRCLVLRDGELGHQPGRPAEQPPRRLGGCWEPLPRR